MVAEKGEKRDGGIVKIVEGIGEGGGGMAKMVAER